MSKNNRNRDDFGEPEKNEVAFRNLLVRLSFYYY